MLTSDELDRIRIEDNVFEFLPEAVARSLTALPIAIVGGTLHLAIPVDRPAATDELIAQLRFALEMPIIFGFADRMALEEAIDVHYSIRHSVVQNCPRHFLFRCSKRWEDLTRSEDDRVRHCTECDKDVHLCKTSEEISKAAGHGYCIAFYDAEEEFLGIIADDEV